MEFTLDEALQKGVEAHKAGNAQEADRYYTAILKVDPKHPDANHNMGVLAVGIGKVEQALPFFKTALEVNATIVQYWLSYIDALIRLERFADAEALVRQAKSKGLSGEGFDQIEQRLGLSDAINPNALEPSQEELQVLITLYTQGHYQETLNKGSQLLKKFPNSVNLYNIVGASHKGLGKLDEATVAYKKAVSIKPDYAEAHNNMGNALKDQGNLEASIEAFNKALSIKPDYAEAYYNMGITLKEQGKLVGAIEAYTKALSIKPDYAAVYNNMGIALRDDLRPEEAIESYKKALSIKPDYAEAYYNMGNTLQDHGKLEEAIESYKKALSIKPDYAEAYNNMGTALKEHWRLEEAIESYKKALSIEPDYAEAYNNMGSTLQDQGKLIEAMEAFNTAIVINCNDAKYWNNLYFPLQAIKYRKKSELSLNELYPKSVKHNYGEVRLSILDYKVHRGQETERVHLDRVTKSLSSAENITIKNPIFDKNITEGTVALLDKMVALVHFGRSGTGLLHSLIDGHPEVSTLPSIYFSEYFDLSTWTKITSDGWDGMVDRFVEIYDVLFDPTSSVRIETKSKELIHNIGVKEGLTNVGDQKDEVLILDKKIFRSELKRLVNCYDEMDAFVFFKLVHVAYDKVINDYKPKSLIFYHIHNPDTCAQLNFTRFNPDTNWIMMVREPIQSCESWIQKSYKRTDHFSVVNRILTMLFEIDNVIYSNKNSVGVRLEDLKKQPEKTIPALCKWMGIEESDSLYEMTAQGKKWWGDPTSPDYEKDGNQPFGTTSIERKVGSIFSDKDQFILRTLFYPFSVRFGYTEENEEQFKGDLQKIRPMLDEIFDFERTLIDQTGDDMETFKKSVSYLYLRSGLIERWNTLDEFYTYPNMIQPLKIDP